MSEASEIKALLDQIDAAKKENKSLEAQLQSTCANPIVSHRSSTFNLTTV
jgi:hypothetical protein